MPWSAPSIGAEEEFEVFRIMQSGWVTMGKQTEEFEHELGKYIHNYNVSVVNNGTSAILAALIAEVPLLTTDTL